MTGRQHVAPHTLPACWRVGLDPYLRSCAEVDCTACDELYPCQTIRAIEADR